MRRIPTFLFGGLVLLVTACSSQVPDLERSGSEPPDQPIESADTTSTTVAVTATTELLVFVPEALRDLDTVPISIVDREITYVFTVAVADSGRVEARGLMNIADLGDLDGMLFVWDSPTTTSFWMKDTILPLDIAFFDEDFALVDNFEMAPCTTTDCPSYPAAGAFNYAVEVPATGFAALTTAAQLVLEQ